MTEYTSCDPICRGPPRIEAYQPPVGEPRFFYLKKRIQIALAARIRSAIIRLTIIFINKIDKNTEQNYKIKPRVTIYSHVIC